MLQACEVLEELVREGTLSAYAIGGGIAATFYVEPILTYDLDTFVLLPTSAGPLISMAPLYDRLRQMGFVPEQDHVLIAGLPVQLIPAYNALVEEGVREALALPLQDKAARVLRPEHLLAIMIQTGRPKDRARAALFLEEAEIDRELLRCILKRHALEDRWDEFVRRGQA
jgi:hypothetical protein